LVNQQKQSGLTQKEFCKEQPKAGALFYSLIETCKANNIEPYQYFCGMLHRIRLCKSEEDYRNLLPQFIKF